MVRLAKTTYRTLLVWTQHKLPWRFHHRGRSQQGETVLVPFLVPFVFVLLFGPSCVSGAEIIGRKPGDSLREFDVHWAFVPLKKGSIPQVADDSWPWSAIDHFIKAEHESRGLDSGECSDPLSLLRRLRIDLTGLPPTHDEIAALQQESSQEAVAALVNRLLASPAFGEHWGRYWLDIVRYADSFGSTRNHVFPLAWKYRNYVLDSFHADKPFDVFLREQIAGDLLPPTDVADPVQARKGTGFLTLGCRNLNQMNPDAYRAEEVAEQIDTFGRAMMGLTVGCARCHDHKTAPIPITDYYALAGVFYSTQPLAGFGRFPPGIRTKRRYDLLLSLAATPQEINGFAREERMLRELLDLLNRQIQELQALRRDVEDADPYDAVALKKLNEKLAAKNGIYHQANLQLLQAHDVAMGARDAQLCQDVCVQIGGDLALRDEAVRRAFLPRLSAQVSADFLAASTPSLAPGQSGRLQLARWLTQPEHPLVARVMVNRVWGQLFGRGLVRTVDNFGPSGDSPTHPGLLDSLALDFIESGYSIKQLIRKIVLSRVYQQSTRSSASNMQIDPGNVYLWRMKPRRLDVEAIRDAMLAASGELDRNRPAGSLVPPGTNLVDELLKSKPAEQFLELPHRTVYLPVLRRALPATFQTFDFAPPEQVCGRRDVTTVPTQALYFLNNALVIKRAAMAAERLLAETPDLQLRLRRVYLDTVGRPPTDSERCRAKDYVSDALARGQSELSAWNDLYHAQFGSAEFFYRN